MQISGNNIIFEAYENAVTINTYSMKATGPYEPVLFSTNQAEIRDIIELIF